MVSIWDVLPESREGRFAVLLALAPPGVAGFLRLLAVLDKATTALLAAFIRDPTGFIRDVAAGFLIDVAEAIAVMAADLVLWFFLGGDRAPGDHGGPLGVLDLFIVPLSALVDPLALVLESLTAGLLALNAAAAQAAARAGLAAFPVVVVLVVLEVAIGVAVAYGLVQLYLTLASFVDVPFVDTGELIETIRGVARGTWDAITDAIGRLLS